MDCSCRDCRHRRRNFGRRDLLIIALAILAALAAVAAVNLLGMAA
jgi:hypothetical protein